MNNTVHNIACAFVLGLNALTAVELGMSTSWWGGDLEDGKVEVLVSHPDSVFQGRGNENEG